MILELLIPNNFQNLNIITSTNKSWAQFICLHFGLFNLKLERTAVKG